MKVETPQLRWHQIINPKSTSDAGANGPIFSCSLLTIDDNNKDDAGGCRLGVLATSGSTEVNLWRVRLTDGEARVTSNAAADASADATGAYISSKNHILVQPQTSNDPPKELTEHTQIEHIATLSRGSNERSLNAVKFSPSGNHLVAAGDGGTVLVWSLPPSNKSGKSFWSKVERETDLSLKICFNQSEDVLDVSWSADSRRFVVCSLDHTVTVWEAVGGGGEWKQCHRSSKDHTHYVQGVAYDPKDVYLASMGSDRMVKVYSRKNVKDNVIKGEVAKYEVEKKSSVDSVEENDANVEAAKAAAPQRGAVPRFLRESDKSPKEVVAAEDSAKENKDDGRKEKEDQRTILQTKVLPELLSNSTFALQKGTKTLKFLPSTKPKSNDSTNAGEDGADSSSKQARRHHMFADELTLGSFFRRLAFTPDGSFLVVPAALWHGSESGTKPPGAPSKPSSPTSVTNTSLSESSFATYLFARHNFDQPYKVLTGLEKPSMVVRPNPVLFQLPLDVKKSPLPYRSIFAVLTGDAVLVYDTHQDSPLAMARGLHYGGLTDAAWSADGKTLFVTSSDGYVSILSFGDGELGEVYVPPEVKIVEKVKKASDATDMGESTVGADASPLPSDSSKQPESNNKEAIIADALAPVVKETDSAEAGNELKKVTFSEVNEIKQIECRQPAVNMLIPKKKKKKIAPTPVTTVPTEQVSNSSAEEGGESSEKKRSAEEVSAAVPSTTEALEGVPINNLVAKKKQKVAGSSTPVATS